MALYPNELVIDDDTNNDLLFNFKVDGEVMGRGEVEPPADQPREMFAPPSEMQLIPRSEWSDRIKEQEKQKSRTSDILLRAGIPSTDQGSWGYCWAYSTVGAVQALRAINGQPHVPLNAHSVAATIKKGANQGGWCGLSMQFLREKGVADMEHWKEKDGNYRAYQTPEVQANMALHKVTEEWVDLGRSVYEQNLTFDQIATCALLNIPMAWDFAWWGHSTSGYDLVEVEPGDFGIRGRNSWTDRYGDRGFYVLRGSKLRTMGAVALRVARAYKN